MTEEEAKAVSNQESGAPEAKSEDKETPSQVGSKEYNFRQLERERDEYRRRFDEQQTQMNQMMNALTGKSEPKEEVLPELSPDDIPEWRHVDSKYKKLEKDIVSLKKELEAKEKAKLPELVRQKYPDFDSIVTADRVKQLENENPALAQAFSLSDDPYTAVYSYFKAVHASKKQDPAAIEEAEKLLQNANKPVSSNAVSRPSALKSANAFQKKPKDQLYREMMEAASRAN